MLQIKNLILTIIVLLVTLSLAADPDTSGGFYFTTVYDIPTSPVKNQAKSGTCWSFAGASFIETEIIRMTGNTVDISEMYFVRNNYSDKARSYVRLHGGGNI